MHGLAAAAVLAATPIAAEAPVTGCLTLADFTDAERAAWRAVNDDVMGGRSRGGPAFEPGRLIFEGAINTDGGGFSSVRAPFPNADLAGRTMFRARVKTDGRAYALTVRSRVSFRGRPVSYRGDLSGARPGAWSEVEIPFSALAPTRFGRRVPAPPFDPADALTLGFIISDGVDGAFRLEVERVQAC